MKIALAIVALAAVTAIAQPGPLTEKLDAIAGASVAGGRTVGVAAGVMKGDQTLLLKGYGQADIEAGAPMTTSSVVSIASVTKQFTAAAVLQLRDQGKLGLDDNITKWLPDFDMRGNNVTLRTLLNHTSGIAELTQMQELRALRMMVNPQVTHQTIYDIVNRTPFTFPTGTLQIYSNTNFWLLGRIIEKASGLTYEDYVETRMFAPLGMTRSMYCNEAESVTGRAAAYRWAPGTPPRRVPPILHTGTYSAGAICSTVEDMLTWVRALHGGKVLSAKSYGEMITPAALNDGTRLRYAMGTTVAEDTNGLRYLGHNGGGFGHSAEARWYPDASLAVVVLANSEPDEVTAVTESLAAAVIPPPAAPGPFKGDVSEIAGTYKGLGFAGEMVVVVTATPDGPSFSLRGAPAAPLPWVRDWTFRRGSTLLTFRRSGTSGPATELRLDSGGDHLILKRQ